MGGFRSGDIEWIFPAGFPGGVPTTSAMPVSGIAFGVSSRVFGSASVGTFNLTAVTIQASSDRRIRVMAIGRWF